MSDTLGKNDARPDRGQSKGRRAELIVFAVIAAFIWPLVAVGVVGGYAARARQARMGAAQGQ